MPSGANKKWNL